MGDRWKALDRVVISNLLLTGVQYHEFVFSICRNVACLCAKCLLKRKNEVVCVFGLRNADSLKIADRQGRYLFIEWVTGPK